uniref:Uncharacterized protein n=1 Tax=Rhizophora mucronata TaxID=61149 RepID=A0A2P2JNU9_RHIMU
MTDTTPNITKLVDYNPSLMFLDFQTPLSKKLPLAYGGVNILTDIVSHNSKNIIH